MNFDVSRYRVNKPQVKAWLERTEGKDLEGEIAAMAVAMGCPLIAVYCYVGELIGFTPDVKDGLERIMRFYKYTSVTGIEEPYLTFTLQT